MSKSFSKAFSAITILALVLMALPVQSAGAAGSLSTTIPVTQNFDGIGTTGTAPLPADFKADRPTTVRTVGTFAAAGTATTQVGGANLSTTAANGIYNFGSGTTTTGSDRAIGFLSSGTATQSGNLYAELVNNTGGGLSGLQISYDVEKYRNGSNAAGFRIQLYYSTDGTTWTSAGSDFLTNFVADANNSGFATAPGTTVSVTNKTLSTSIPNASNFYLAWNYSVTSGTTTTNAQALAVDNISILGITGPTLPDLTIDDVSFNEGNSGQTSFDFKVSLSSPAGPGGVTFDITTADGTAQDDNPATEDNDYVAQALMSQTIPEGSSGPYTFSVAVNGDTVTEPSETFLVNVTNVTGATLLDGQGQGTIQNDDAVVPDLTINDVSASEGNSGTSTFSFTVSLSAPAGAGGVTFDISTADGTAQDDDPSTEDNDYVAQALMGQSISAGNSTYNFEVTVNGDTSVEPNETFFVNVTDVTGANLVDGQGQGTIQNDDAVPPGSIVISQVYGGGGNTGATFKNDFIELYNRSGSTISLSGWSVQYASATGTGTWQVTPLTGSLGPGEYYLVQEAAGAGGTVNLPTPDATGTILMSATAGKVALVSVSTPLSGACPSSSNISDLVGYGTNANCFEGAGRAPAPSNTTAVLRLDDGAQDTDNNNADFVEGVPNPRSRTPSVVSTTPSNGEVGILLDTNITINFSKPMDVTGNWFTISCASTGSHSAAVSGGPQSFILDPDVDFAYNELCTVTIVASQVTDQDANDPPDNLTADYVFSFTTFELLTCGAPATLIHDVQGSGAQSPLANGTIVTIEGVVVSDYQESGQFGGFHIQEEDADADVDPTTSEGIFVFNTSFAVNVGDKVAVKGSVFEFFSSGTPLTELNNIRGGGLCNSGNSVTPTTVTLPVSSVNDWERYEGMLINISQSLTVTETFTLARFGEVSLSVNGRLFTPTNIVEPGAPATTQQDLNNRSRIVLDDGNNQQNIDPTLYPAGGLSASNTLRSGYTVSSLTGVLEQRFGVYRVQPVGPISFNADNPRPEEPEDVGGTLKVVGMNLLNFFNTFADSDPDTPGCFPDGTEDSCRGANSQDEFDRQYPKTVAAILAMDADVIGVNELENDGYGSTSAIQFLVDQLNAVAGSGTYAFINVDANTGQTNAMGTDAIKVAILYKPSVVTPVGQTAALNTVTFVNGGDSGPRSRPSLAQAFQQNSNGEVFIVDVNHLKSKGSACDAPDAGDGQGNCNQVRKNAATELVNWLASDPTGTGDTDILLIGDYNSYAKEDPIDIIKAAGYTDLIEILVGAGAYSYVFDAQSGYLDHALASSSLTTQVSGVTEWHINADEPIALDYNLEFKSPNHQMTLYAPDQFRVSDHDPVIVGLNLDSSAPNTTIDSNPSDPSNDSSPTFEFSGTDDVTAPTSLIFECDLDGGGFTLCTSPHTYPSVSEGSHTFQVRAKDSAGNVDPSPASFTWTIDTTAPSVTIEQASGQADPTGISPINFTVVFSEDVTGFDSTDVTLSAPAGATAVVTGGPATYNVAVSGMTANGTVTASIPADAATDAAGNGNTASTSTDNTVTFANAAPTIAVAAGGSCTAIGTGGTLNLTVSDAENDALTLSGSSSNTSVVPNANITLGGSGANRTVAITAASAATVRTATVTVTVSDGISSASVTITVTVGTTGNNTALNGTSGADLILGLDGNDTLNGLGGNDLLCGGAKNDILNGGDNDDTLIGQVGNDVLTGGTGADSFSGGAGNDTNTDFNAGQGDTSDGT